MKRIYLTLIVLATVFTTNAGERLWNFDGGKGIANADHSVTPLPAPEIYTTVLQTPADYTSWTATLCTSSCSQGLELCPNYATGPALKPDPTFGTFGGRLKLAGFASAVVPPAIPTTSYVSFNVDGNVEITLYCNPKVTGALTVNFANSSGSVVTSLTTSGLVSSNAEVIKVNYTGPATKLTMYPTYNSTTTLYIYAIAVKDSPPTDVNNTSTVSIALKKVGNQLQNEEAAAVEIYTVLGAKVLASSETSIDISGLASGVYIAKTPAGSIKFIK